MKKIGLILSSGGGRGFAHIGVLKVLQEHGVRPDYIIGSSMGALVGAMFCQFEDARKIEQMFIDFNWKEFSSLLSFHIKKGLLNGAKVEKQLNKYFQHNRFEDLKIPFEAVATDFFTAEPYYFNKGSLAEAVHASIAVPLLIEPLKKKGRLFWDGGLSDTLPVKRAAKKTDITIAVNLNKYPRHVHTERKKDLYQTASRAIRTLEYHLANVCAGEADILLEPDVGREGVVSLSTFLKKDKGRKIIKEGEKAAAQKIQTIKEKAGPNLRSLDP